MGDELGEEDLLLVVDAGASPEAPLAPRRVCREAAAVGGKHPGGLHVAAHGTNQTQEGWVYSHGGPIRHRKAGYILTVDQSDASQLSHGNRGKAPRDGSPPGRRAVITLAVVGNPKDP
eukprot:1176069-Prorocentrum_minimum.AAC.1